MKIVYSKHFPPKGFSAINLFGIIIGRKEYGILTKQEINHENIHTTQIKELLGVFFYVLYLFEWLIRLMQYRNMRLAYYNISFEREAYMNDSNLKYLDGRPSFSFVKYYRNEQS